MALKELNETSIWLSIVQPASLIKVELLTELTDEHQQLCGILDASVKTMQQRHSLLPMTNDQ